VVDRVVADFLGLEQSKFEWAAVEKELQEHQELQERAMDNLSYEKKVRCHARSAAGERVRRNSIRALARSWRAWRRARSRQASCRRPSYWKQSLQRKCRHETELSTAL